MSTAITHTNLANATHEITAKALNPGGTTITTNANAVISLGPIKVEPLKRKAKVAWRATAAYGAGESLAVSLHWLNAAGVAQTVPLVTLNATLVAAAGSGVTAEIDLGAVIPAGAVVSFSNTYTAGTPNDPTVSLSVEIY